MKLTEIAVEMKAKARALPDAVLTHALPHGAILRLKYTGGEYRLQIVRTGRAPDAHLEPRRFGAWQVEIKTFARDFGATSDARITHQHDRAHYAAVVAWADEMTLDDLDEMEHAGDATQMSLGD